MQRKLMYMQEEKRLMQEKLERMASMRVEESKEQVQAVMESYET